LAGSLDVHVLKLNFEPYLLQVEVAAAPELPISLPVHQVAALEAPSSSVQQVAALEAPSSSAKQSAASVAQLIM